MSPIDSKNLMSYMQTISKSQAAFGQGQINPKVAEKSDFGNLFGDLVGNLNAAQSKTESNINTYMQGGKIDIAEVMVDMSKSKLKLQAAVEVRNKFVDFYQQIMNMSV